MSGSGLSRGARVVVAAMAALGVGMAAGATAEVAPSERSAWGSVTSRASVSSAEQQANGESWGLSISRGGRYVAFDSHASNLVTGDTNGTQDIFVRDRLAGVTRRVSVGPGGRQANRFCWFPEISDDGRYVAFSCRASNLVRNDTNGVFDVFVRNRVAGVTRRVSVGPGGRQGNGASLYQAISGDGRVVAFNSDASNLVAGDTNDAVDVFVRDQQARVTRRVSVGPGGREANDNSFDPPAISANGRYVAFTSDASNLVRGDTNRAPDVFVRDRQAKVTRRVSVGPGGRQANGWGEFPEISDDGRRVVFYSDASNLVRGDTNDTLDVFVRDRQARVTRRVSVGPGGRQADSDSYGQKISADGRHIAFASVATNLVRRDTNGLADVFVRDRRGDAARWANPALTWD